MSQNAFDVQSYDKYIIFFSGGKDSIACFLHLLESGIDKSKIELWHHDIDGDVQKADSNFMDWPITHSYCESFAEAFGVPIYFSWKSGGFKGEMLRENQLTAPIQFEDDKKVVRTIGGIRGKISTRRKFPQVSPDLSVRWCSSYLKISAGEVAITNQERFRNIRTLTLSGERGEESAARGKYAINEPDRADLRDGRSFTRTIDRYRPIRDWKESQVWAIIEKYKIRLHPSYYLGFSRCSCLFCIFSNSSQFKSAYEIAPSQGDQIIAYEKEFGVTKKETSLFLNYYQKVLHILTYRISHYENLLFPRPMTYQSLWMNGFFQRGLMERDVVLSK